jgi:hypothetical protein
MKNYCIKFLTLAILASQLTACTYFHSSIKLVRPPELDMTPPPGPPIYQQGWSDGCQSGFKGYAGGFTKMFYSYKQDPELAENPVYYQIWKDAYMYCANYAMASDEHGLGNVR